MMFKDFALAKNLASFRRVPPRIVALTFASSLVLLMGAITMGQPLYIIVIMATLPLIPVLAFEGLWKVRHYNIIAVFMIITILQLGHLGEHITQVAQLGIFSGTLACPPPIDDEVFAGRAVEAGLRSADSLPTGIWTQNVVKADKATGLAAVDASGNTTVGPAACGILGRLDIEIVHLVWDSIGWLLTLWLLTKFPKNKWLWFSMAIASWHTVEHFFISYIFFFDSVAVFNGAIQLWGTVVDGNIVTAHPVGLNETLVNFYGAGGKNGILGRGGFFEMMVHGQAAWLPTRPWLHFGYNTIITIPLAIAFIVEMRNVYDIFLKKALPNLSKDQLIYATTQLRARTYKPGDVIIEQGAQANNFFILSKGSVDVVLNDGSESKTVIDQLGEGDYFGEMGLAQNKTRNATVIATDPVEVMVMDGDVFRKLLADSELTDVQVAKLMNDRFQNIQTGQADLSAA